MVSGGAINGDGCGAKHIHGLTTGMGLEKVGTGAAFGLGTGQRHQRKSYQGVRSTYEAHVEHKQYKFAIFRDLPNLPSPMFPTSKMC